MTDDWYAQDMVRQHLATPAGQTTEYERGKPVSTAGSFEAGVDGAQAGVIMPARPRVGLRYRQEYYEGRAEDKARVFDQRAANRSESPDGHFRRGTGSLMTKELNPLEPKTLEYKFMLAGWALVLAVGVSGGSDREELLKFRRGR